ncbi:MAG TPA: thiamine phosphate synthase [Candidatus Angelobacter sp.]|nr:thiamine phosphate synthase [Candidatus Angelobacter sp.]
MAALLYYITDRRQFPGDAGEQERRLLKKIAESANAGVDMIQLREKDLSTRALEALALQAMAVLAGSHTRLLINSRTDIALACGAHGVHLPSDDLAASEVRTVFSGTGGNSASFAAPGLVTPGLVTPIIGVSAHSAADVASAEAHGADFAVFAPVFEKNGTTRPDGLEQLQRVCHRTEAAQPPLPVLALGGITLRNARRCLEAGAAGIAAIRLFQQDDVDAVVKTLRENT